MRLIFFSFSFLSSVFSFTGFYAYAQVTGDYRSDISVLATDWSDRNNWQIFKGSWQSPNATDGYPGQFRSPGTVTIREHIFIFFPLAVVADITPPFAINNLVVNDGGELNTTGDPSLTIAQTLTVSNGGSMSFGGG
ncbi:MAG TPA: hypothetical protein VK658_04315, partial [Chryseolinea sp.]|nr:hypothetical protein [Chryseolinea sp.]